MSLAGKNIVAVLLFLLRLLDSDSGKRSTWKPYCPYIMGTIWPFVIWFVTGVCCPIICVKSTLKLQNELQIILVYYSLHLEPIMDDFELVELALNVFSCLCI